MTASIYDRIEHVVVLMLENRSFDHVLGSLQLEGRDVDGVDLDKRRYNVDLHGHPHFVAPLRGPRASSFVPGPPHGPESVADQTDRMSGFVRAYQKHSYGVDHPGDVMKYLDRGQLPMTYFLADHFTICNRWFSAVPTDTIPNRLYSLCGEAGDVTTTSPELSWIEMPMLDSIFEQLDNPNDWAIYTGSIPLAFVVSPLRVLACNSARWHNVSSFRGHVAAGRLPKVTWIEPTYYWEDSLWGLPRHIHVDPAFEATNDDHPPSHVEYGQALIRYVYESIAANPEVWKRTLLVVTYDEHGGFYDHVQPPRIHHDELGDDGFTHRGPRVPAILVSPYTPREVCREHFDHCSILKFLCEWLGLEPWTDRIKSRHVASLAAALADRPHHLEPPRPTHTFTAPAPAAQAMHRQFHGHVPGLVKELHRVTYRQHREAYERVFPHASAPLPTRAAWWFA